MTTSTRPTADRTAPRVSNGRVGSAGTGSLIVAAEQDDDRHDHGLEHERRPPADRGGDEAPDQRPGGGADAAHAGDHAERLGARRDVGEQHRGEDVDRRDQQGRADAFEDRVADEEHADARRDRAQQGADPVDGQTEGEAPLASPLVGQLAAGDHQRRHHQQEDGDDGLHALDGRVQVRADVGDHHVHVRAREAADELRAARAAPASVRSEPDGAVSAVPDLTPLRAHVVPVRGSYSNSLVIYHRGARRVGCSDNRTVNLR